VNKTGPRNIFYQGTILQFSSSMRALLKLVRTAVASDFILKVAETFATRIFMIGIGLVTSVIVTRSLGPEGRGLYAVASAIGAIGVQFGNLGLHASNTYTVAKDRSLLSTLVGNSLMAGFVFGGLGSAIAWLVFFLVPKIAPLSGLLLILGLSWIPFGLAYMLLQNILLGIQDVRSYNKIELVSNVLGIILLVPLILFKLVTAETVFSVGLVLLLVNIVWVFRRLQPQIKGSLKPSLDLFRGSIGYGMKAYLAAFCAFLVLRIDMLMVKYMLGAEQTGFYAIAVTMADMVYMLPVVIGTILFPKLSAMKTDLRKWNYARKVALWVCLLMMAVTAFSVLCARPAIGLLYGRSFLPAVPAFVWLMPGIVMISVNIIYMNYFASIGMPAITVYSPCAAAAVNIALNMKLIPMLGIVGASISSTLAYGLMLLASLTYIYFILKRKPATL
jgi:O-antigen/teichoic acid export membrane protein